MKFMKGEYGWRHLAESSKEAQHCMQHALGCGTDALCVKCDHQHHNTCVQCNAYPALVMELEKHILAFKWRLLNGQGDEAPVVIGSPAEAAVIIGSSAEAAAVVGSPAEAAAVVGSSAEAAVIIGSSAEAAVIIGSSAEAATVVGSSAEV